MVIAQRLSLKKLVFRNFKSDLNEKIRKSKRFELLFKFELAKLKITEKFYRLLERLRFS